MELQGKRIVLGVTGGIAAYKAAELVRLLGKQGWLALTWPKQYGGPGWTATQRYIFDLERAMAGAPPTSPFGVAMVGPVL